MATVSLSPCCNAPRDNGCIETGIQPSKTGLADEKLESSCFAEASLWRCDSVCMERTPVRDSSPQSTSRVSPRTVSHTTDKPPLAQSSPCWTYSSPCLSHLFIADNYYSLISQYLLKLANSYQKPTYFSSSKMQLV